jgi:capsule polysaccharide export protein KpsE/RkpR
VGFMGGIFLIILVGILADTIVKIVKHRAGSPQLRAELEELRRQLDDQANRLTDAQTILAGQDAQLQEMQERLDFAERLLTQGRDRPGLGAGPSSEK